MVRARHVSLILAGIVAALATSAQAAPITVPNGDFATSLTTYTTTAGDVGGGWMFARSATTVASGINDINPAAYTNYGSAVDEGGTNGAGKLFIRFTNATTSNRWGTLTSPSLGVGGAALPIAGSSTYTLTVAVGNRSDTPWPNGVNEIQLLSNGTSIAATTIVMPSEGTFSDFTVSFSTDALGVISGGTGTTIATGANVLGGELKIRLYGRKANTAGSAHDIEFDSVRLDVVPEPASMSVLAVGALALLARKRRS